ncbi:hypothetical protein FYK55_11415 [Roseiconus nitratireducens]|uniref:Uncharacterized protein n=1 Tax=Roseiconus nitratireducens TaxID=2605748 RepID=A0A5M6DCG7_9BACT|nr:hypothetical protein [Roseiconus nitratireducens]KAA5543779.1 hypothetical protein FYK55_11415 [Roseiconus nitratireducens]
MKFAILALLIVVFIAFVVMVVKAAKEWRWYHITSAVIAMLMAMILLFPTAGVLKSRQAWHKLKEDLEVQLERVKQERQTLQYGDADDAEGNQGVKDLSLELSKIGTEAGRRWRNLGVVNVDANGQVTLRKVTQAAEGTVPGVDPEANAPEVETPLVPVGLVVYGFAETNFPGADRPVPTVYLGEFRVTASAPESVTVVPTIQLERNQADAIASGRAKMWSLYELLPLDGHEAFIAEGSKADDDNVLGRVDDQLVKNLLKNASPQTLQSYLNDGKRGSPEDPAARWVKIEFTKKYTIDVDSPDELGALEGGFFDNNGRAVDSRLQRADGGSISFSPGDVLVVKEEAAKQLVDQEKVASLVDTYYLRPLNDYRYALRRIRLQIKELDIRIAEMEYEKKVLETATAATVAMLEKRQIEKLKLEQDLAQYQVENSALQSYHSDIREQLRQMNEAASSLYRSNFELLRQIQQLSLGETQLTDT